MPPRPSIGRGGRNVEACSRVPMNMHPLLRLAASALAAALLVACDRSDTPTPAATPTPSPIASATPVVTATSSPSAPTTPIGTPTPLPPAGPTPPPGYAASCASIYPWGKQVTKLFVCIDEPKAGVVGSRGGTLVVRGYAGGSFENNVVVEVRAVDAGGRLAATPLFLKPLTYSAPDLGMPGAWQMVIPIPANTTPSNARVIAHFESPKDGERVAEASVEVVIR